jgi:hypothetical protein
MGLQDGIRAFFSTLLVEARDWPSLLASPGGRVGGILIREFRLAGAVSRATAKRFRARTRAEELALAALLQSGVLKQPVPGRFYVDESEVARFAGPPWPQ